MFYTLRSSYFTNAFLDNRIPQTYSDWYLDHHMFRTIIVIILLLIFISPVQAVDCFAPSPSVKKNIDIYEEIQTRELTNTEYDELSQLFKHMQGAWTGKAETVTCKGDEDAPREEKTSYTVDADIESGLSNSILFSLKMHSSEKKQSNQEKITYYLTPKRLGVTELTRAGDVELINIAPNFLVYLRKINRHTPAGGLVAQEFVKTLAVYDHSMMIEDLNYSNGVLDSRRTVSLNRR